MGHGRAGAGRGVTRVDRGVGGGTRVGRGRAGGDAGTGGGTSNDSYKNGILNCISTSPSQSNRSTLSTPCASPCDVKDGGVSPHPAPSVPVGGTPVAQGRVGSRRPLRKSTAFKPLGYLRRDTVRQGSLRLPSPPKGSSCPVPLGDRPETRDPRGTTGRGVSGLPLGGGVGPGTPGRRLGRTGPRHGNPRLSASRV